MNALQKLRLPRRVLVEEVVSSRYSDGCRPLSWDSRSAGVETVRTVEGEVLKLFSGGGQSTPKPGWELLLVREAQEKDFEEQAISPSEDGAVAWTLYGIKPRGSASAQN